MLFPPSRECVFHVVNIIQAHMCDWILENRPIVTLRLFHFTGPANGYTHTLPNHSAITITRLDCLVCFSRVSFPTMTNSWDPWSSLHGRHRSEIHPSDSKTSIRPSEGVWAYGWHFLDSIASPNSPKGGFNPPPASHTPTHTLIYVTCDITMLVEKVAQKPAVLAS